MKDVLTNLLRMEPQNLVWEVYAGAALVWIVLLAISMSSILSVNARVTTKVFWTLAIIALPLVGLAAYCVYMLFKLDWAYFQGFVTLRQGSRERPRRAVRPVGVVSVESMKEADLVVAADGEDPPLPSR